MTEIILKQTGHVKKLSKKWISTPVWRVWRIMIKVWHQNWLRKSPIFIRKHKKNDTKNISGQKWHVQRQAVCIDSMVFPKTTTHIQYNIQMYVCCWCVFVFMCLYTHRQGYARCTSRGSFLFVYCFHVYKKVIIMIIIKIKIIIIIKLSS